MTENETHAISRRSVLQRGAFAGGVLALGVTGFSGTALASDCPRTPGFWANKDWCDVLVDPDQPDKGSVAESIGLDCSDIENSEYCLEDTGVCMTMAGWQEFLVADSRGDKGMKMAQLLLATNLSFQRRSNPDSPCVDQNVDFSSYGLSETTDIRQVRRDAEEWLEASSWPDSPVRSWTVEVDGTDIDGEPLKDILDAFLNDEIGELDCDCNGDD